MLADWDGGGEAGTGNLPNPGQIDDDETFFKILSNITVFCIAEFNTYCFFEIGIIIFSGTRFPSKAILVKVH